MNKKSKLKKIQSLEKQKEIHKEKIESYEGKNYTLSDYWEKEIQQFEKQIQEEKNKLEKKKN